MNEQRRSCHNCGMCCTLLQIEAIDKPADVRCPHLKGTRCSIYEDRPQACRTYLCGWLQGAPVPKPSKAGFITDGSKVTDLTIHMSNRVRGPGKRFLQTCEEKGLSLMLIWRDQRQLVGPSDKVSESLEKVFGN